MYTITCARSAKTRIEILCPMNNFYRAVRGIFFILEKRAFYASFADAHLIICILLSAVAPPKQALKIIALSQAFTAPCGEYYLFLGMCAFQRRTLDNIILLHAHAPLKFALKSDAL